jgi:hypothetical protein
LVFNCIVILSLSEPIGKPDGSVVAALQLLTRARREIIKAATVFHAMGARNGVSATTPHTLPDFGVLAC